MNLHDALLHTHQTHLEQLRQATAKHPLKRGVILLIITLAICGAFHYFFMITADQANQPNLPYPAWIAGIVVLAPWKGVLAALRLHRTTRRDRRNPRWVDQAVKQIKGHLEADSDLRSYPHPGRANVTCFRFIDTNVPSQEPQLTHELATPVFERKIARQLNPNSEHFNQLHA